jgi:hypothetical protein
MSQLWEALMQTSRFQLGLIATLAVGLGFSLSSSQAIGYPAGAAVSTGFNPVMSVGGSVEPWSTVEVATAPADSHLVLTDIVLGLTSTAYSCRGSFSVYFEDDTGKVLGDFALSRGELQQSESTSMVSNFNSGLRVAAGRIVSARVYSHYDNCGSSYWTVRYTASGYYARP